MWPASGESPEVILQKQANDVNMPFPAEQFLCWDQAHQADLDDLRKTLQLAASERHNTLT